MRSLGSSIALLTLLSACSDDVMQLPTGDGGTTPPKDAQTPADGGPSIDTGTIDTGTIDTGTVDTGLPMDGGTADTGAPTDGGAMDGGTVDGGTPPCASLQRDVCIVTPGCVLDGSESWDPGYFCRDAASHCENIKDDGECMNDPACTFEPGGCYCPEGAVCACGGGRAPVCREFCGGIAGIPCPTGFFCDLLPASQGQVCAGNADQGGTCTPIPPTCMGAFGGQVCGCENDITPVTYMNDCERRLASASFGATGACP